MSWSDIGDIALAIAFPEGYNALNRYRQGQDLATYQADASRLQADPTYIPRYDAYRSPESGIKAMNLLQQQAAAPLQNKLEEYKAQGWSSDPSFTGKEWAEGLLSLDGIKPDMNNPNVLAAVNGFAGQAQKEK